MQIHALASKVSDNWFYAIESDRDILLVDPIDAATAVDFVRSKKPTRVRIFNTHGHPDHIGGNDDVVEALSCDVIASRHPDIFDPPAQQRVGEGDSVVVGNSTWQALHAPGHTAGHIVLYHPGHLICGDVFFIGGAGNCRFGGDPGELYATFHERLVSLPDDTKLYPGHDYAVRNLEFCLEVEATNAEAARRKEEAIAFYDGQPRRAPYLTTLGEEKSYNPFHRVHEPALQETLRTRFADHWPADDAHAPRAAFKALRATRDTF